MEGASESVPSTGASAVHGAAVKFVSAELIGPADASIEMTRLVQGGDRMENLNAL